MVSSMPSFRKQLPLDARVRTIDENLCVVLAFDPGETTGWCVMGVSPLVLWGSHNVGTLQSQLALIDYGQIDCVSKDLAGWFNTAHKHSGMNMEGENAGIETMVAMAGYQFPKSAVVIEDFIPDMKRMDQARHTLSPVRITAGFSFGLSQLSASRMGDERIFIQGRSMAKTTCTDARLRNWGLYDSGSGPHARDAVRHAYYFLRSSRGESERAAIARHLAWPHLFDDPVDINNDSGRASGRVRKNPPPLGEII